MRTCTRERSYLGLLRAFLPGRKGLPPTAGVDHCQAAMVPGQNQLEVYGLAVAACLFQMCWVVEAVGSLWLGVPLSFVFIHVSSLIGALVGSRLPTQCRQAYGWPQRLQWFFLGVLAWIAIKEPFTVTQWLAWPLMLLLTTQLVLWPSEPSWTGVLLFLLAQALAIVLCLALPQDWRWGLPVLFSMHAILFYGAFHSQAEVFGPLVRSFRTKEKEVWLTIDDGPSNDTLAMLDLLDEFNAKATFFVIGKRAETNPEQVVAIDARGHQLGNHTFSHPAGMFWAFPGPFIHREIQKTQDILTRLTGTVPKCFRSPVGFKSPMLFPVLEALSLQSVGWSARGYDGVSADVDSALNRICSDLNSGDIILLHEGHAHNLPLARRLLERLKAEGFHCVVPNLVENEANTLS
jgi:peptidoglycan-N-acetylglucosamine deacetylase